MRNKTVLLFAFILIKFIIQYFLISPEYDLQRDEYLHLDQAHHLAWGYESVPPFTSWVSYLILQLGNSIFWVKFFPTLFGALTIVVVWKTIEVLNGNLFALVLGATAVTISSLLRINILYQPNSFDILSWTIFYYTIICYIKTQENKWLYLAAISFSVGFLNKYNIGFLLVGLIPAILATGHRKLVLNKHVYFAMFVALLLVLPNLVWQYQNRFPVFHHMKELADTQLVNVKRGDFLKEQLLFFFNSLFVLLAALISFFIYPPFRKYRLFFWSFLVTLFVFAYLKAKGYYAIGLYPILLAFGSVYLGWLTKDGWKKWLRPIAILIPIILFLPAIKKVFPVQSPEAIARDSQKSGLHRWEDGKDYVLPQDFADMLGWRELAAKTDSIYKTIKDKEHTIVFCDNYGEAGAINYYSKQKIRAVSMNADYINWFHLEKDILQIISVKEKENTGLEIEKNLFNSITPAGTIENKYAREKGTCIFILSDPKININKLLSEEIEKRRSY